MCTTCTITVDETRSSAFAERMLEHLNSAAIVLMSSIGHRTGLFRTMAELEPSTSREIADAAGLDERYVREWLGAMVTGRIVEYDAQRRTYALPPEHAAWLTDRNGQNMAVTAQWLPVMASVEDRVVESFQRGGGLSYDEYRRFHEVMADESGQTVVAPLLEHLLPLAPGLRERLERGAEAADVGCGSGRALNALAGAFPKSRFTGYDLSEEAIARARAQAAREGLTNVTFVARDVAAIDDVERFDAVFTFDAIHDQARPAQVLRNIYRALKPGGVYFCQDIAGSSELQNNMEHPLGPFMYTVSCTHCMSVSLAQEGAGLGTMWGKELACRMFEEAGFTGITVRQLEHDVINNYYVMQR